MKPHLKNYLLTQVKALEIALSESEAVAERLTGALAALGDSPELDLVRRKVEDASGILDQAKNELKAITEGK